MTEDTGWSVPAQPAPAPPDVGSPAEDAAPAPVPSQEAPAESPAPEPAGEPAPEPEPAPEAAPAPYVPDGQPSWLTELVQAFHDRLLKLEEHLLGG